MSTQKPLFQGGFPVTTKKRIKVGNRKKGDIKEALTFYQRAGRGREG